jgi:2-polyprenyl-3-methyl-5-hydroxy-6-metoxy-1,4-benzoquinol methylase
LVRVKCHDAEPEARAGLRNLFIVSEGEGANVKDMGDVFGLRTQDLDSMCISERVQRLETSASEIGSLMEAIRSTFAFRMIRRLAILKSQAVWTLGSAAKRGKGLILKRSVFSYQYFARAISDKMKHIIAVVTRRYYIEDYVRVYPGGIAFDKHGRKCSVDGIGEKNFLNHLKFYNFAAQFVRDKCVADVGCGSGYGCELLKRSGAATVFGSDISRPAIEFAKDRYRGYADFVVQGITHMKEYRDSTVDVAICSEVLEHVKEYGAEKKAILELKRITRNGGLLIIGTPNSEMLEDHGFSFEELARLLDGDFSHFCIFENALVPSGKARDSWNRRLREGSVGIIVNQNINLSESVWTEPVEPEIKKGLPAGRYYFSGYEVDTSLLHNTHSWVILAVNEKEQ